MTNTLDAAEHAGVEAHLDMCLECSAELELERLIGRNVTTMAIDVEQGWAAMEQRIAQPQPPVATRLATLRDRVATAVRDFGRVRRGAPPWLGWALATQLVVVALAGVTVTVSATQPARYHVLGAQAASASGNAVVIFRPETSERDLRGMLQASNARLVDGPTSTDAYVLHIPRPWQTGPARWQRKQQQRRAWRWQEPIDAQASP